MPDRKSKRALRKIRLWYQQEDPQRPGWDRSGYRYADRDRYLNELEGHVRQCQHCRAMFLSRNSVRRYCSIRCSNDAYILRRRGRAKRPPRRLCAYCGKEFQPKRRDAKFCTTSHRVLAYLQSKRASASADLMAVQT